MRNGVVREDTGAVEGFTVATGTNARLGANSIGSAASVGAIAIPVAPPLESGAIARACHWRCSSVGRSLARGSEAKAIVLHRSASPPPIFQPGRRQAGASERLKGCAWLRDENISRQVSRIEVKTVLNSALGTCARAKRCHTQGHMAPRSDAPVRAILGPTNTGKTYLAIERMCGHSSGVIGFPLRLLAREVYDRVVAMKGDKQVGLLTGEERIVPPHARYFLCTAESMPVPAADAQEGDFQRDFAFAAIDEAQLGIDPERGHVFTDRMLRARGGEETLILGSDTLRPIIRELLPEAEIVSRPRFSTLRYSGSVKLSRLPPRSAVVAFSAEQVYALAEMLRRFKGVAAVVMGALSPATRNAQVAMFQRG